MKEDNVEVSRAGGVSSYHSVSGVLLCGGRNGANQVLGDCIQYNLTSHMVSDRHDNDDDDDDNDDDDDDNDDDDDDDNDDNESCT